MARIRDFRTMITPLEKRLFMDVKYRTETLCNSHTGEPRGSLSPVEANQAVIDLKFCTSIIDGFRVAEEKMIQDERNKKAL